MRSVRLIGAAGTAVGVVAVVAAVGLLLVAKKPAAPRWEVIPVGTDAKLRGLCVVTADVVWAGGTNGTFLRTSDGGKSWTVGTVPGAEGLDFRDVEAFDASTAYLLAAGEGEKSRIYKTTDGGQSWTLQFTNPDPAGFYDALAFWDATHGIALGDPVNGRFQLLHTIDGTTWQPLDVDLPPALAEEGAFAASGTCLVTHGEADVWFGTGGPNGARVFHSADRGKTWTVSATPITAGSKSAGVFSLAFRDGMNGVIVGGDYTKPDEAGANAATTTDGGKTWTPAGKLPYRSCVTWAGDRWLVAGTSGADESSDGWVWTPTDGGNFNSVGFAGGVGWAIGPDGRVARWR